ncbi:MAG: hypothetical protein LBP80_02945 [Treponema sp.]|jgi:hypothetical protein|nr:hypothetical protein [Treponema sp.]
MNDSMKKAIDVLSEAGFRINYAKVETWRDLGFKGEGLRYCFSTGFINLRIIPNDVEKRVTLDFSPEL